MNVAVIGATGFIGRHLCDTFIGRGDSVSALVRRPEAADALVKSGVSVVRGDLADEAAICQVCSQADAVFNVAGVLAKWNTQNEELEQVNARATGTVVRCAARAEAGRVVHTSTAGVSGPLPADIYAAEDYPAKPATEYQRTKLAGESAALKAHRDTGIPLVIVRPAFVYGPGDKHKLSLFRAVASGRIILVNGGSGRLHPVFVDDVVYGLISAAERAPGFGEVYILAGPSPLTTRKLLETIAWALAVPAPKISLPESLLLAVGFAAELMGRAVGREPPITRSRVRLFSEHYAYCTDKTEQDLGFKPVVDFPEGARRTTEWYHKRGLLMDRRRGGEDARR